MKRTILFLTLILLGVAGSAWAQRYKPQLQVSQPNFHQNVDTLLRQWLGRPVVLLHTDTLGKRTEYNLFVNEEYHNRDYMPDGKPYVFGLFPTKPIEVPGYPPIIDIIIDTWAGFGIAIRDSSQTLMGLAVYSNMLVLPIGNFTVARLRDDDENAFSLFASQVNRPLNVQADSLLNTSLEWKLKSKKHKMNVNVKKMFIFDTANFSYYYVIELEKPAIINGFIVHRFGFNPKSKWLTFDGKISITTKSWEYNDNAIHFELENEGKTLALELTPQSKRKK